MSKTKQMNKFITLTRVLDGVQVHINVAHIARIKPKPSGGGSVVYYPISKDHGIEFYKEEMIDIITAIRNAKSDTVLDS